MSHFTTVETKVYEESTLRDVIKQLGYRILEEKELKGYNTITRNVDFQVEVHQGYNIGFKKVDRTYKVIGDRFLNPKFNSMLQNILQGYSSRIVMRNAEAMGYTTVKRTVDKDKTIKLVLVKR